jgi:hypothetical protein
MSEVHDPREPEGPQRWLTDTAAAIAGFSIAILSLLVNGAWTLAIQTYVDRNGPGAFEDVVMVSGVAQGLLAIAALVLGRRGVASSAVTARNLGGAAVVLGALGLAVAVLIVASGLVSATN